VTTKFNEWTKRLGQQHFSMSGQHETLCGMPMLGNNYASVYDQSEKEPCADCKAHRELIEVGESHD